ncbi:polysaccharide export protein [Paenimyroides tangerinum]|uniref:Polysaccharide export protein n=1 Tax=Paenimyroides tangerinum TaxID=2488728 RepID=A0A3P3W9X9_9FLAO|nr:polysaccharide biosynthesis/export family protein [Paenimyroides tangerinum]RRJ89453.1 polysaccharide export protein [Paenimyroides tangerinum]
MKKIINLSLLLLVSLFIFSCASKDKIIYYENAEKDISNSVQKVNTRIQPDDLLMIIVSALDPDLAIPFNLTSTSTVMRENQAGVGQQSQQLYLVDGNGNIEFPVIGQINVLNKTKQDIIDELQSKISVYINNPIINVRIMNFKVTVQGEVNRPGVHTITSERLTVVEALSLSGDLTIYGNRNNILIFREENGKRISQRIDITKTDFINSPFYYLKQNDIVYVEPNKTRVNASAVGPNASIFISIASLVIGILTLISRN